MIIDIRDPHDVKVLRRYLTTLDDDQTIGITSGCYDLFHSLHLTYLQRCRRMCDMLIVGIDSDDLVKQTKGDQRPIIPEHQRIMLLNALKCVDVAFIMSQVSDFHAAVEAFRPKFIFKNQNFRPQDVVGNEFATVITVPDVIQAGSTSGIIEAIKRELTKPGAPLPSDIAPAPVASKPSVAPAFDGPRSGDARSRRSRSRRAR